MTKKPKIGDYGIRFKPEAYLTQDKFNEMYPQGQFGKVIGVEQRYNSLNGKKLPLKITLRVRNKDGINYHTTFPITHYKPIIIK